jgi:threonine synthase
MTSPAGAVMWQVCIACGARFEELDPATRCRSCGGLLDVKHQSPAVVGQALRNFFDHRSDRPTVRPSDHLSSVPLSSGVWRFQELVLPGAEQIVSYPEGNTPLLRRAEIAAWAGISDLSLKHEGQNPTGSFKDRGMTVAITQALRIGARAVVCASTGNTSASLAAYGAQAGLPVFVLVPSGMVARGKLAQTVGFGAQVLAVRGDFDACLRMVEQAGEQLGLYLLNSVNPFRIEGQKTIVFELLLQRGWQAPDWIVLPGGNLGNTAAFGKALEEAKAWGLCDRMSRLAVVQAEGAAPFARSYGEGFRQRYQVEADTVATAIRIGNPASWDRAVRAIQATNGVVLSVPDAEILAAKAVLDHAGVGCEPASAASLAGLRRLTASGTVSAGQSVAAILTGHMLKDPEILLESAASEGKQLQEIDATVPALAAAIERTGYNPGKTSLPVSVQPCI